MSSSRLTAGDIGEEIGRLHERLTMHGLDISPEERKRGWASSRKRTGWMQVARSARRQPRFSPQHLRQKLFRKTWRRKVTPLNPKR
ncbi:hypothetical protein HYR99_20140 [Candidatus Poribacteria bacterium]|nr:hypothetical protein [Candidatus Poribacteria bacterium]